MAGLLVFDKWSNFAKPICQCPLSCLSDIVRLGINDIDDIISHSLQVSSTIPDLSLDGNLIVRRGQSRLVGRKYDCLSTSKVEGWARTPSSSFNQTQAGNRMCRRAPPSHLLLRQLSHPSSTLGITAVPSIDSAKELFVNDTTPLRRFVRGCSSNMAPTISRAKIFRSVGSAWCRICGTP
jgi:hypothetical protein